MARDPDERGLRESVGQLADHYEATAPDEAHVVARIEQRLARRRFSRVLLTIAAGVIVALAALGLPNLLSERRVGTPSFPAVSGIFVTSQPDASGRCYALRIYDTTPRDGRVALWTWEGPDGCATRTSGLLLGAGSAMAVAVGQEDAIRVDAAPEASGGLAAFSRILLPDEGRLDGYATLSDAEASRSSTAWRASAKLDVPYQP